MSHRLQREENYIFLLAAESLRLLQEESLQVDNTKSTRAMIARYLQYLVSVRRYSANTIKSYTFALTKWAEFCQTLGTSLQDADINDIREWAVALSSVGLKPQTINARISAVKCMYQYAIIYEQWTTNPADSWRPMKAVEHLPVWISSYQMEKLFDKMSRNTWKQDRGYIVALWLYCTGARCQETCDVQVQDINFAAKTVRIQGKGAKIRFIPLLPTLLRELAKMISRDKLCSTSPLFRSADGAKLEPWQIRAILSAAAGKFLAPGQCHPHVFRHSFATALVNGGAQIQHVQLLLGHSSVTTTQIYTHVATAPLLDTYKQCFPHA